MHRPAPTNALALAILLAAPLGGCSYLWPEDSETAREDAPADVEGADPGAASAADTPATDPAAGGQADGTGNTTTTPGRTTAVDMPDDPDPRPRGTRRDRAESAVEEGKRLSESGDLSAALAEFERAIAINPDLTAAYLEAASLYRDQGRLELAEARARRAAELEPQNFRAQYMHATVLQLMGRRPEAVRTYLRALAIRPDDVDTNLGLGTTYLELEEPAQALPYLQVAVRRAPDRGEARLNLGAAYAGLDRHEEAIIEYQQAAELLPEPDTELLLSLADSLGRVKRYAEMVATLDQLIRREPSALAYERLGSGLFRMKRYDAALDAFRESARWDPSHYPAHNGVAVCRLNTYLWSGRADQQALRDAIGALRESLRLRSDQPQIIELLRRYGSGRG